MDEGALKSFSSSKLSQAVHRPWAASFLGVDVSEICSTVIQKRRHEAGLTIRDLAKALGFGFSIGRLSMGERGLLKLPAEDQKVILGTIERLAPLCKHRRRIVELAKNIDFAPVIAEVRDARAAVEA